MIEGYWNRPSRTLRHSEMAGLRLEMLDILMIKATFILLIGLRI